MAKCSLSQFACKPEPSDPSKENITVLGYSKFKKWVMATLGPSQGKYPDFSEKQYSKEAISSSPDQQ